jgi:hypothetical protein
LGTGTTGWHRRYSGQVQKKQVRKVKKTCRKVPGYLTAECTYEDEDGKGRKWGVQEGLLPVLYSTLHTGEGGDEGAEHPKYGAAPNI